MFAIAAYYQHFWRRWRFVYRLAAMVKTRSRLYTLEHVCSIFNQVNWHRGLPWDRNTYRRLARAYNTARHRTVFAPWLPPAPPLQQGKHGRWVWNINRKGLKR